MNQGNYREEISDKTWICPECETINTGDSCILCGTMKVKTSVLERTIEGHQVKSSTIEKKRIKSWIIYIVVFVLIAVFMMLGSLFTHLNGWKQADGIYYYYQWGKKTTGRSEIDGKQYFFSPDGAMLTGWLENSGETYYYGTDGILATGLWEIDRSNYYFAEDGTMQTGFLQLGEDWYYFGEDGSAETDMVELNTVKYFFDDSGRMSQKEYSFNGHLETYTSEDDAYYVRNDKKMGSGKYQILRKPSENITELTVTVNVYDIKAGNVKDWGFYVRDLDGNWIRCGDITVEDKKSGSARICFDTPISFDAYVCFCESLGNYWNFGFDQVLSNIRVVEYCTSRSLVSEYPEDSALSIVGTEFMKDINEWRRMRVISSIDGGAVVDAYGDIWYWGKNSTAKKLNNVSNVVALTQSFWGESIYFLRDDGNVGFFNLLSDDVGKISLPEKIVHIIAGQLCEIYAIGESGNLYRYNIISGELKKIDCPVPLVDLQYVEQFNGGTFFARAADGSFWGWGQNVFGTFCDSENAVLEQPVKLNISHELFDVRVFGTAGQEDIIFACTDNSGTVTILNNEAISLAQINECTIAFAKETAYYSITKNGELYAYGNHTSNADLDEGTIGVFHRNKMLYVAEKIDTEIDMIGVGGWTVVLVMKDGSIRSWGQELEDHVILDSTNKQFYLP